MVTQARIKEIEEKASACAERYKALLESTGRHCARRSRFHGGGRLEDACVGYDVPQNRGRRSDGTTTSTLRTGDATRGFMARKAPSGMDGRRRILLRDLREDNSVSWDASISAAGGVQAGAREFRHTPSDDRVRRQMPVGETTRRRSWRRSSSSTSGSIVCTISCPVYGDCCPQTLDVPIVPVAILKKQHPA